MFKNVISKIEEYEIILIARHIPNCLFSAPAAEVPIPKIVPNVLVEVSVEDPL